LSEARNAVTVRIAGEEHTIRANAEPEYTRSCARYVDERIAEIRSKGSLIETHKAAILAALSISDELLQAREELDRSWIGSGRRWLPGPPTWLGASRPRWGSSSGPTGVTPRIRQFCIRLAFRIT
jgi:cell division protein ZapA (FtsZ GTPase activity inhibitor)